MRMTNPTNTQGLTASIERLVREQVAEIHQAVEQAVRQAFSAAAVEQATMSQPSSKRTAGRGAVGSPSRKRPAAHRRTSTDVAALGERLWRAVSEHPGESMAVLSGAVGASARELHRPMTLLRRDGRVRSVGERHATRYFPMAKSAASNAANG